MWVEEPKSGGWGEQPITPPSWGTKPKTPTGGPGGPVGWAEPDMDLQGWGHQNKVSVADRLGCHRHGGSARDGPHGLEWQVLWTAPGCQGAGVAVCLVGRGRTIVGMLQQGCCACWVWPCVRAVQAAGLEGGLLDTP